LILLFKLYYGDCCPSTIFGFVPYGFYQWMRLKEFREAAAQCPGSVAVDQANLGGTSEGGLIEKFVHAARGFFNCAAYQVDFLARGLG
jgi:hypothetical protein